MRNVRSYASALVCTLVLSCLLVPGSAWSQTYPSRSITMVVAFAAGGFADGFARVLGVRLSERLGQPVVIENRAGAGGNIAAAAVSKAPADGYTVLVNTTGLVINETLTKNRGFALSDLKVVAISAWAPEILAVNPKYPAKSLTEFVENAKGKQINFGTPGIGTSGHIATAYFFKEMAKINAVHVPFQGGAPAVNAAIGGHIDSLSGAVAGYASQLRSGAIRGIAVASEKRLPQYPEMPTYAESGFPGLVAATWVGFFLPAKTDDAIAIKLNEAIDAVLKEPDIQERLNALQMQPRYGDRAVAEAFFKSELTNWTKMIKAIGLAGQ